MSSTDEAPPDSVILAGLGGILLDTLVQTATFTLIYGIFILLFAQSTMALLKKSPLSRANLWMILASALAFLLATLHEGAILANFGILIHSALVGYQEIPLTEKPSLVNGLLMKSNILITWMCSFEPIVSDCIVVWRAFVLLRGRRWMTILPMLLLLGSIISALLNSILLSTNADIESRLVTMSLTVSIGLSLGTNIVATSLIFFVYWLYRKDMAAGSSGKHRTTQAESILVLVVESGVVFCLFQTVYFVLGSFPNLNTSDTAGHYAQQIFTTAYFALSALYATAVVAMVHSRRTLDQMYSMDVSKPSGSSSGRPTKTTLQSSISFALPESSTSTGTLQVHIEKTST